ncbi:TetR/AcrR family transcriptional regulator [Enterococcus hermanniensis]|uniref:TetR family transcriptional regulator n=1 Tax=Enterococcus hermanniensis TaxID=249189 RepID=A0A1L8TQC0_9ENTE|nr:TetR/AcrR family transcriptional regulator [Enterococcus hermanniensis]OJG46264.1 TetR family transcriptional regulator [Enterococcus hermanniensis]
MKSKEKLQLAANKLFIENGYENTTIEQIAQLAGVTKRTFYRQFKDKSDVLFDADNKLGKSVAAYIKEQDNSNSNYIRTGVDAFIDLTAPMFSAERERIITRYHIIQNHPDLLERELLKMFELTETIKDALKSAGLVDQNDCDTTAELIVLIFKLAFQRFVDEETKSFVEWLNYFFDKCSFLIDKEKTI